MRLLLLEDDVILNEIIAEFLIENNLDVDTFYDGEKAIDAIFECHYDILLLDVNVPKLNGFELLEELSHMKKNIPTILITSLSHIDDVKKGFTLGAEDYLKKPFELEELLMRINRTKILHHIENDDTISLGDNITYHPLTYEVHHELKVHKLRKKEAQLLDYFIQHKNSIISFEKIVTDVWEYKDELSHATIRTYIKNLRAILGKDFIENIKGVGYQFKCL